jgi:hypothetical protein
MKKSLRIALAAALFASAASIVLAAPTTPAPQPLPPPGVAAPTTPAPQPLPPPGVAAPTTPAPQPLPPPGLTR